MWARRKQPPAVSAGILIMSILLLLLTPSLWFDSSITTTNAFAPIPFTLTRNTLVGKPPGVHRHVPFFSSATDESNTNDKSPLDSFTQEEATHQDSSLPPSLWSKRRELVQMTRPSSIVGIILFHMVGTYLALSSTSSSTVSQKNNYWNVLLKQPSMWLVFLCEVLVSSTSMIVNDYHDAKLGRDVYKSVHLEKKVLVSGKVPLALAKKFVSNLYALTLVLVCSVEGSPTRLIITSSLMLTFLYTKHLKPKFGIKNIVCALLVASTPWTSAMGALYTTATTNTSGNTLSLWWTSVLLCWRLVACLFFGVIAREVMLDCNDVDCDTKAGISTIPVKYGCPRASAISLLATGIMSVIALSQPLYRIRQEYSGGNVLFQNSPIQTRRLGFALTASIIMLRRSWQVFQTRGKDPQVNSTAVDESVMTVVFLLASFI